MDITTIIFDLGGVIIDVDEQRAFDAFRGLGLYNIEEVYTHLTETGVLEQVETGAINADELFNHLNRLALEPITPSDLTAAWNSMLLGIPDENIILLRELSTEYRLLALSDTNAVHIARIEQQLGHQHSVSLSDLFSKVYYSFQMGLRKPDAEIFKRVLAEEGLSPSEILFIDDLPENTEAADRLGFRTELIHERNPLLSLFK